MPEHDAIYTKSYPERARAHVLAIVKGCIHRLGCMCAYFGSRAPKSHSCYIVRARERGTGGGVYDAWGACVRCCSHFLSAFVDVASIAQALSVYLQMVLSPKRLNRGRNASSQQTRKSTRIQNLSYVLLYTPVLWSEVERCDFQGQVSLKTVRFRVSYRSA